MALRAFVVRLFVLAGLLFVFLVVPPQGAAGGCPGGGGTGCCVTDDGYTCCYIDYGTWQWCIINGKGTACAQGCMESNE